MKGAAAINRHLNGALGDALIALNQYFLHARMLRNWGFAALGKTAYAHSIAAMKEADRLIERLLFLESTPNMNLGKLLVGQDVPAMLRNDLKFETGQHKTLAAAIAACEQAGDYVSRDLLAVHLRATEARIDFHETQLGLIEKLGIENYLQSAAGETED